MHREVESGFIIHAGDIDGLGRVYSDLGTLISSPGEKVLRVRSGCDAHVTRSWRNFFAKTIFSGAPGKPDGQLHVTTQRLVLIREIDVWQQVKPLLTPLGFPAAAEKEAQMKELKARGGREYCEVPTSDLGLARAKEKETLLILYLIASSGQKYRMIVYTDASEPGFFAFLRARFPQRSA